MKFKHLPRPQIPQKLDVGLPFGAFGTCGGGCVRILEIQNTLLGSLRSKTRGTVPATEMPVALILMSV